MCNTFLQDCCLASLDLNAAQGITQLDGHALKWERHAEFFTLTLVVTSSCDELSWTARQPAPECVRMIRRLLEIETYRMMSSLSLTMAKDLSAQLDVFDKTLVTLSERNAGPDGSNAKALLADISNLSAQVVSSTAKTRHRFSATQAYAQLVYERLGELRESHVGDCQRLGVFIERRFKPRGCTCSASR